MNRKLMFAIRIGERAVFIDSEGKQVGEPVAYAFGNRFHGGYCPFRTEAGFGFMSETGEVFMMDNIFGSSRFSEGLCAVEYKTDNQLVGKIGYINDKLEEVIPAKFRRAGIFNEGIAVVSIDDKKYGVIDKEGNWVIKPKFNIIGNFVDGVARAMPCGTNRSKYGLIDKEGNWVAEPKYLYLHSLGDGIVAVENTNGYISLMTTTGELVTEPRFNHIGNFNNGVAPACEKFLWGYINTKGEWVVEPKYHKTHDFSEGRAVIEEFIPNLPYMQPGRMVARGIINDKFEIVVEPKYRELGDFEDGYAHVQTFEAWGKHSNYIDKSGNLFIPEDYRL